MKKAKIFFKWLFYFLFFNFLNSGTWFFLVTNFYSKWDTQIVETNSKGEIISEKAISYFQSLDFRERGTTYFFIILGIILTVVFIKLIFWYKATTKKSETENRNNITNEKLLKFLEKAERNKEIRNSTTDLKKLDRMAEKIESEFSDE